MEKIEEVFSKMKRDGISALTVNRLRSVKNQFASVDAFIASDRDDVAKAYSIMFPLRKYGLSHKFWDAYDMAKYLYVNGIEPEVKHEESTPREEAKKDVYEERMFDIDELKAITSFMELCDVEAINLRGITEVLSAIKIRKHTKPDGETNA